MNDLKDYNKMLKKLELTKKKRYNILLCIITIQMYVYRSESNKMRDVFEKVLWSWNKFIISIIIINSFAICEYIILRYLCKICV